MSVRSGLLLALAVGAGLVTSPASAQRAHRPVEVTVEAGAVFLVPSAYRTALQAFGWGGLREGPRVAVRALWQLSPRVLFGGRAGWFGVPVVNDALSTSVNFAAMGGREAFWIHVPDAGAVLRVLAFRGDPRGAPPSSLRFAVDVEAGLAVPITSWAGGVSATVVPRVGVAVSVQALLRGGVPIGFRAGFDYVASGGASGGSYFEPGLSGLTLGLETGGRR